MALNNIRSNDSGYRSLIMAEYFRLRRRRIYPYCVALGYCGGLCNGLGKGHQIGTTELCFDNSQWIENFRIGRHTLEMLCNYLDIYLAPKDNSVHQPRVVNKQLAIALYWLSSPTEYQTIENLLGVGKSTVCESVHKVCTAINDNILQIYVSFPSGEGLKTVTCIRGYKDRWGFPNCGRAIDGTHVPEKERPLFISYASCV